MDSPSPQEIVDAEEDMRHIRAIFTENGKVRPKHRHVLDCLARFCRIKSTSFGFDSIEHTKMLGRMEMYNLILMYVEMPQKNRTALREQSRRIVNEANRPPEQD